MDDRPLIIAAAKARGYQWPDDGTPSYRPLCRPGLTGDRFALSDAYHGRVPLSKPLRAHLESIIAPPTRRGGPA